MGGFILSEPPGPTPSTDQLSTGRNPIPQIANIALDLLAVSRAQRNPTTSDSDPVGPVSDQPYRTPDIGSPGPHLASQPASLHHDRPVEQISGLRYPPLPPGASPPDPNLAIQVVPKLEVEGERWDSGDRPFFLTYELLEILLKADDLDFNISTTTAEIEDKCKGDFVTKLITCLQVIGFIIQCLGRLRQGLAITKLELVTVALAIQSAALYFFWFAKPLNVKEPIRINLKRRLTDEERTISDARKQGSVSGFW